MNAPALVMAPVSPAVAKLLHQLQAQMIKEAEAAEVPPGAAILPRAKFTKQEYLDLDGHRLVTCTAADGAELRLQTPFVTDPKYQWQRPGVWYGSEGRIDDTGRRWQRSLGRDYVTDNFGELVPVGGAA